MRGALVIQASSIPLKHEAEEYFRRRICEGGVDDFRWLFSVREDSQFLVASGPMEMLESLTEDEEFRRLTACAAMLHDGLDWWLCAEDSPGHFCLATYEDEVVAQT